MNVCLGRGADAAPGDRVAERVALKADEFQGLPDRGAGRHLVAALQAREQGGRCRGRVARHGDPRQRGHVAVRGSRADAERAERGPGRDGGADAMRQAAFCAANHWVILLGVCGRRLMLGLHGLLRRAAGRSLCRAHAAKVTAVQANRISPPFVWAYVFAGDGPAKGVRRFRTPSSPRPGPGRSYRCDPACSRGNNCGMKRSTHEHQPWGQHPRHNPITRCRARAGFTAARAHCPCVRSAAGHVDPTGADSRVAARRADRPTRRPATPLTRPDDEAR